MKTCFIRDDEKSFFAAFKLQGYDDFARLDGVLVSNPGKRPVYRVTLGDGEKRRNFYLKRMSGVSLRGLFRNMKKGVGRHGDAYKETAQVERYERAGIPVMRIAAWGEEIVFGWPRAGFLLAAEVDGERLDRFLGRCDEADRERAFRRYGELIGQMHRNGIGDIARVQDIICSGGGDRLELTIIDREHGVPKSVDLSGDARVNALARTYLKNLSALAAGDPMRACLRWLLAGYLGPAAADDVAALDAAVRREAAGLVGGKGKFHRHRWLLTAPDFTDAAGPQP